ncbi:MBL fold metallo-hydrolase [Flavobacterium chilense]|uniref:L-ascorbate metabolism protein UlaG, beta-lactamase superfamily n=1 Tax=Flavobacterium chilense TaxID=946677 RepID=A0A1M7LDI4_9FLAO|nr:MBL fold metallo-hydrolase [Flavobacterium chilense]SHM76230.1 L-ascorbate metabolism protein UlaG, beta-lactamase superfamily [Flavobacterium chilense]
MTQTKKWQRLLQFLKRVTLAFVILIGIITLYMMHPQFGKRPSGEKLERIKQSAQFKNGKFRNTNNTPQLTQSLRVALYDYLFNKSKESAPNQAIPSVKINWNTISEQENSLIWLGHSSYFIRIDGKNILVDPVLSGSASPIPGGGKAFKGSDITTAEALPNIDYLFISHDHYDHMDYKTLKTLQTKVSKVIVGLGVGSHLEYWGYTPDQIIEKDWWEEIDLGAGFKVTVTPARHFSGRSIWSANTLWTSYVLQTPSKKLYFGGDSGYDTHFKEIGEKLGPFDLAILENGQYDLSWKYIHMMPEEVVQAAKDLKAAVLFPVHSSKFVLANHSWYEPLERVSNEALKQNQSLITPLIGEIVNLNNLDTKPVYWWKK